jgi:molybdate transport system ATP-binding protein
MSLDCELAVDARGVAARLEVPDGATMALIGPNGSGKSTVLAAIAGLLRPDRGRIVLGDRVLLGAEDDLPAHRRRAVLLGQEPSLFGHLSVLDNVAFGPRSRGLRTSAARAAARRWLRELDADRLADRRPRQLSGGQAQRVALARALAAEPEVLLLDEPLSALDVEAAARLRHMLRDILATRTTVLVTHDVLDAVLLGDEVAVMSAGAVVEAGPADTVAHRPRTPFAASFFGWNLISGTAVGGDAVARPDGLTVVGVPADHLAIGNRALARFRPSAVAVYRRPPHGSPRNVFPATVTALEPLGHLVRVRCGDLCADITPAGAAELGLGPGAPVWLVAKAAEVGLHRA